MILEILGMLSDAQELTATAASTNTIDLASATGELGVADIWIVISTAVAADFTTGDETYSLRFRLIR